MGYYVPGKVVMVMKKGIHPEYQSIKATCVCGAEFDTGSTESAIRVDICSKCHPFFTGSQKIVDTEGRVDRFNKKYKNFKGQTKKKTADAAK